MSSNVVDPGRSINKRAAIDELNGGQPPAKKDAEPFPPQEVLELREKLAKIEWEKARAFRIAGEWQARAQYLENILENKRVADPDEKKKLIEEHQKKINDLSLKVAAYEKIRKQPTTDSDEKKKLIKEHQKKIDELSLKVAEYENVMQQLTADCDEKKRLMEEQQKKIDELSLKMCEYEHAGQKQTADFDEKKKKLMEEQQKKISELSLKVAAYECIRQQRTADSDEKKKLIEEHQKKIDELSAKVTQYERVEQEQDQKQQSDEVVHTQRSHQPPRATATDSSANIFELCLAGAPGTISLDSAISQLSEEDLRTDGRRGWKVIRKNAFKCEKLHCNLCKLTVCNETILMHLYCDRHGDNVRAANGAVSLVAFKYWMNKLESITKTKKTTASAPDAANDDDDDEEASDDNEAAADSDAEDAPDANDDDEEALDDDDDEDDDDEEEALMIDEGEEEKNPGDIEDGEIEE